MRDSMTASTRVAPEDVHAVLSRHLLVDGYHLVLDLRRSHGPYLFDLVRGREVLDFFGSFSPARSATTTPASTTRSSTPASSRRR